MASLRRCAGQATMIATLAVVGFGAASAQSPAGDIEDQLSLDDFPIHQTSLPARHRAAIEQNAVKLLERLKSERGKHVYVIVSGFADFDARGRDFERQVSEERAAIAVSYFKKQLYAKSRQFGFDRETLDQRVLYDENGHGTSHSKPPKSEADRRKNRRVEVQWLFFDTDVAVDRDKERAVVRKRALAQRPK